MAMAATLLCGALSNASTTYDDVAVVVNTNSGASMDIGQYFQNARSVPPANMIYIASSTAEEIDSTEFQSLRAQIENYLVTNNLVNSINYIVTTKGVPLKVNRGNTYSTTSPSSSVESELALVLGPYSASIGQSGRFLSPYYYQDRVFSRSEYGIFIVTRLDAYSVQQVYDMIDRSGPDIQVGAAAKFVLDQDPTWDASLPALNTNMGVARTVLADKGVAVSFDSTDVFTTRVADVLGYVSWGSNDDCADLSSRHAIPCNTWVPGGIAETYVSTSGRSFEIPPVYGQSLIVDLIAEGASGARGYVYEPFSSAMSAVQILFDRYTSQFNLGESFFMASRYLSWMGVVVGDPKTSVVKGSEILPAQLQYLKATCGNSGEYVDVSWATVSELNNYGFRIQRRSEAEGSYHDLPNSFVPGQGTTLVPHAYSWRDQDVTPGVYSYRLKQIDLDGTEHFSEPTVVRIQSLTTTVHHSQFPNRYELAQNYPNPFNPSTTIGYSLPQAGHVKLVVFSEAGEEIATLVDGHQEAGVHTIAFAPGNGPWLQGRGVASSVYFYRMQAGDQTFTRKMILLK